MSRTPARGRISPQAAGLIIARKKGRERWNHLNALPIKQIHDRWISNYARNAFGFISRLEKELDA